MPNAGDPLIVVDSEEKADQLIEMREALAPSKDAAPSTELPDVHVMTNRARRRMPRYDLASEADSAAVRVPVVVKADADGTLAALEESILGLAKESRHEVFVDPIASGIGPITASELKLAEESSAVIFSFNVKEIDKETKSILEETGVRHCSHNVIYSLLDEAKDAFAEYMPLTRLETVHGKALVQEVFAINKKNNPDWIAGLRVLEGRLHKENATVNGEARQVFFRVKRNKELVSEESQEMRASSLRQVKENVEEVKKDEECGLELSGYGEFEKGDIIECYSFVEKRLFS